MFIQILAKKMPKMLLLKIILTKSSQFKASYIRKRWLFKQTYGHIRSELIKGDYSGRTSVLHHI